MGATIGYHFASLDSAAANDVRARLNQIAARLGYFVPSGRYAGSGSASALLVAIADGDVLLTRRAVTTLDLVLSALVLHPEREHVSVVWRRLQWSRAHFQRFINDHYHDLVDRGMFLHVATKSDASAGASRYITVDVGPRPGMRYAHIARDLRSIDDDLMCWSADGVPHVQNRF